MKLLDPQCRVCLCVENPVHAERTLSRGDHQLPAGGAGREVFPAGQVAVHGPGRGAGAEEQHQVNTPDDTDHVTLLIILGLL